jgi:hypothetical protein
MSTGLGICLKILLVGLFFSLSHFLLNVILAFYFGLAMSHSGAWFLHNIIGQPGTIIENFLYKTGIIETERYILIINFIFYWAFFSVIYSIFWIRRVTTMSR